MFAPIGAVLVRKFCGELKGTTSWPSQTQLEKQRGPNLRRVPNHQHRSMLLREGLRLARAVHHCLIFTLLRALRVARASLLRPQLRQHLARFQHVRLRAAPAQILFAKVRYGSFSNAQMETIITDPSEIEVFEYLLCVFEDNLGRLD